MKKRDLDILLRFYGWWRIREGGSHEIWTNGVLKQPIPRHKEINELTAKAIIKKAKNFPAKERN